jgi:heme oxygenase (biliverdin-producing, ferredoxin)
MPDGTAVLEETLSRRLRAATQALHREAERSGIMVPLLRGELDRGRYVALLQALLLLYEALEEGLERHAGHPMVAPVRMPELYRGVALRADIEALAPGIGPLPPPPPSAVHYGERLRTWTEAAPHLLVAHAWVRYLGDLSGGRMVGRVVARGLSHQGGEGAGLAFYHFPEVVDPGVWKDRFRDALDHLPLEEGGAPAVVEEAREAFRLHVRIFEELAALPVTPLPEGDPASRNR